MLRREFVRNSAAAAAASVAGLSLPAQAQTDDPGVKDLLRFLITRDHYHQQQWLAAIEELKDDGLEGIPVPEAFPLEEAWRRDR